jgi:hypothetical protein
LKDEEYFRKMKLDAVCGTVFWPNGADFAPEALYALKPLEQAMVPKDSKKPKEKRPRKSA